MYVENGIESACWPWPYGKNGDGYGSFGRAGKQYSAHIFIYELIKGEVPRNCELDHLCRNRSCINPEHLEPVSHTVNVRRGRGRKGISRAFDYFRRRHALKIGRA